MVWVCAGVLGMVGSAALFWYVYSESPGPQPLTAVAGVSHIEDTVLASGTIQPFRLVSVGAQASGRIVALRVALGDHIVRGALVAEIDPSTQRNALAIAEATLDQGRGQRESRAVALKAAKLAFMRAKTTVAEDASSQADYETAEATYHGLEADLKALDAQIRQAVIAVDTARVNLGYTKVIAPIDGTVIAIVAPEGQTVNAVQAAPTIVKLAELETMTVKAQISEADVTRVHSGLKVYFTILGAPERRYEASLRAVEPAPESMATDTSASPGGTSSTVGAISTAVYYNGLFDISNPDHQLRPSMTAQVNIVLNEADHALVIPAAALRETQPDGRRIVRVINAQRRIEPRIVRVGINNRVMAQIISGLIAGERVIVSDFAASAGAKP
jgi:macrolide-specific efflux system membrane fusion protein